MKSKRIHITGGSGSGVTTLSRALAGAFAIPHHDTDDYYWLPTSPPFLEKRPIPDRLRLMHEMFTPRADWVLSGSMSEWADPLIPLFDLVIFVSTPTDVRLRRLREREARHFGAEAIAEGGWRQEVAEEFFDWASGYDEGTRVGRNRAKHAWLAALPCLTLRVDGSRQIGELVREVSDFLASLG